MPATCLFKGQSLLNKPITASDTGAILGYVHDIIFDHDQNQVLAFLVDKRWRVESRVLPWSGIRAVQLDGILTHNVAMLTEGVNLLAVRQIFARDNVRRGTRLLLRDGRSLGRVQDIYFDGHGVMEGYATTRGDGGPVTAVQFIPAPRFLRVGGGRALVPDDHIRTLEESAAARRRLNNGLRLLAIDLWDDYEGPMPSASDEHALETALGTLGNELAHAAVHMVEGCRVQNTVLAPDGRIVAIASQIVTSRVIERAQACNRARELLAAVGADPVGVLLATMEDDEAFA